jgi:1-acyl-sn-glycerol-3-phosphate acyltransferase
MIRFFLLNAFIGVWTLLCCLWGFVLTLFDREGVKMHALAAVPWAKMILWVSGVDVKVFGTENVDSKKPKIYMSNHQSAFDIFALLGKLRVNFKFILKQELMQIPILGFAMRRTGYIAIDRRDPRRAVASINEAVQKIKGGASVLVFPEGTRSPDGQLGPFKKGGFHLALKSECDIVPVTIIDSYRIMPKGSLRINRGRIVMVIGKPINTKGLRKSDTEALMREVMNAMKRSGERYGPQPTAMGPLKVLFLTCIS